MMTVQEFAKVVKVSEVTVYRWIKAGELQVIRLPGGDLRIADDEYARFISSPPARVPDTAPDSVLPPAGLGGES